MTDAIRLVFAAFLLFVGTRMSFAQSIQGSTAIDIDPDTGQITATCETDLDPDTEYYYEASVTCTVVDSNNNLIASQSNSDSGGTLGYAQVVFSFAGTPGITYTGIGKHRAYMIYNEGYMGDSSGTFPNYFYDAYNFASFLGDSALAYPYGYDWYGPGPQTPLKKSTVTVGNTTTKAIRFFTTAELHNLVNGAKAIFSNNCDAIFMKVIGPSYSKTVFFASLYNTEFNQYPGTLYTGNTGGADAATLYSPGRPINLYANFYTDTTPMQEEILTHEGIHHFTGWNDQDVANHFYLDPIKYGSVKGTAFITVWLTGGCN